MCILGIKPFNKKFQFLIQVSMETEMELYKYYFIRKKYDIFTQVLYDIHKYMGNNGLVYGV
jgi:hypothetical protein